MEFLTRSLSERGGMPLYFFNQDNLFGIKKKKNASSLI
jgi:hypothetical protein